MSRRDDINVLYALSNKVNEICKWLFYLNCFLALTNIFLTGQIKEIFTLIQIIDVISFILLKLIDDGKLWYQAENYRRKDSIQTAYGISLSEYKTENYYNNNLEPSDLKYAMNAFESNYFSMFIAKKMLLTSTVKAFIAGMILIISCWFATKIELLLVITQTFFSAYIFEDTIRLWFYATKLNNLFEEGYHEFVTVGIKNANQKVWLLSYTIEYEAIKAYYKIRLDSRIFNQYNNDLSKKWNKIKEQIIIENV